MTRKTLAALTALATLAGCLPRGDAPGIGPQRTPYAAPPPGAVPLGGLEGPSDEDALEATPNPAKEDRMTLVRGRSLYFIHCSPCHGEGGKGDGPVASRLSEPPPDLRDAELQDEASDGAWVHLISEGSMSEVMPGFRADISLEERWILVLHLRSLRRPPG